VRWLLSARSTPDLVGHGFERHVNSLLSMVTRHRTMILHPVNVDYLRARIAERLLYADSSFAFASLWMMLDGEIFEPKIGKKFSVWPRPEINLEFDYGGKFKEIPLNEILYEAGEAKYGFSGTHYFLYNLTYDAHRLQGG